MSTTVHVSPLGSPERLLRTMSALTDQGFSSVRVMQRAHLLAGTAANRDQEGQARAILNWMAQVFKYVPNPIGPGGQPAQRLRDADNMLREYEQAGVITGECAEAAILGATLGRALAIPPTFRVLFFPPDSTSEDHVYTVLYPINGEAVELDVTKPPGPLVEAERTIEVDA